MERGRMKTDDPREQMREEPSTLAQEGAFGLHSSELLKKHEGEDLSDSESCLREA